MLGSSASQGHCATCIGSPAESTMKRCCVNPDMPARTAAADAQAVRPIDVAAPRPPTTMSERRSNEVKEIIHFFVLARRAVPDQFDASPFQLVSLRMAFQSTVPDEDDAREVGLKNDAVQPRRFVRPPLAVSE